ncbi:MAG: hypothetical protein JST79_16330 [Acidobacteria bacterium]|nr:hypothetical protein [Acidobacteriota bacterium]
MSKASKDAIERRTFLKSLGAGALIAAGSGQELASQLGVEKQKGEISSGKRESICLDGSWHFQTDPESLGVRDGWYHSSKSLNGQIEVPGCWQAQKVGSPHDGLRNDYEGWGWYKRSVFIPESWHDRQIWLKVGGVSRNAKVFCNGTEVGYHNGFSSPFRVDVSSSIVPGTDNGITILVDNTGGSSEKSSRNTRPVGCFNYLGNWGGICGHVELQATEKAWIDNIQVRTKVSPPVATFIIAITLKDRFIHPGLRLHIQVRAADKTGSADYVGESAVSLHEQSHTSVSVTIPMPDAPLWSPERPILYVAQIRLMSNSHVLDNTEQTFGLREVSTKEGKVWLNGKPYYLVGYGDDSVEVITGAPPVSLGEYRRRFQIAKSYGFNSVRSHSRIPPEEFFQAADELGLLVRAELPVVYAHLLLPNLQFLWSELESGLLAFRNHPSFISIGLGNELFAAPGMEAEFARAFEEFYSRTKQLNPDILAISTDGGTQLPSDLYPLAAGCAPGQTTIAHEYGGYFCSLPNVSLIPKFTGVVDPVWMRTTASWFQEKGLEADYQHLLENSERMQNGEMRKARIEWIRRVSEVQGYDLWLMTDFPSTVEGFGWEQGLLNFFWEPKNVRPEEFAQFNALNVVVSDTDISGHTWWEESVTSTVIRASYYGNVPVTDAELSYQLVSSDSRQVLEGKKRGLHLTPGQVTPLGEIELCLPGMGAPIQYTLKVRLARAEETIAQNTWRYWAYPRNLLQEPTMQVISRLPEKRIGNFYPFVSSGRAPSPGDLLLTSRLEPDDYKAILNGASAIILLEKDDSDAQQPFEFLPYYYGLMGPGPHAYGSKIEKHPIFHNFLNPGYFDLPWHNLVENSFGLDAAEYDPIRSLHPLVWCVLSSGFTTRKLRKLGFLYEFRAGRGKVVLTTLNFRKNLDDGYPSVVYLFDQLLRYVLGQEFNPPDSLGEADFSRFFCMHRS